MMVVEKEQTVGQAALNLLEKGDQKQSVVDTQKEMLGNYLDQVIEAAERGEKLFGLENLFYVCVQTRRERLLSNVIRNQFYPRQTRPRPEYDLALYSYDPKTEDLRFEWCIPAKDMVEYILQNKHELPSDHAQLVEFCHKFKQNLLI